MDLFCYKGKNEKVEQLTIMTLIIKCLLIFIFFFSVISKQN